MNILKRILTITAILFLQVSFLMAQGPGDPPPPPPGGGHGSNTNEEPGGGGAPIGNGLFILSLLAAGYGAKKLYDHKKKKLLD